MTENGEMTEERELPWTEPVVLPVIVNLRCSVPGCDWTGKMADYAEEGPIHIAESGHEEFESADHPEVTNNA